jgi:hypothetical protein
MSLVYDNIFHFSYGPHNSSKNTFASQFLDINTQAYPPLPEPTLESVSFEDVFQFDYVVDSSTEAEKCEEALGSANQQISELLDLMERVALAKSL